MSSLPNIAVLEKQEYENKKQMLEEFKLLSKEEYEEIFRIIKQHNIAYSENSNGVFFDLATCSTEVFTKLVNYIELCKTQRKNEETRTQTMNTFRSETME
jgi:hypothetical protein